MDTPALALPVELLLFAAVTWIRLAVEAVGVVIISAGVVLAVWRIAGQIRRGGPTIFHDVRLSLAHSLALALEFELAADLLGTAVSPTWDQLGKLAVVAIIRTGLNYFLMQEIKSEHLQRKGETAADGLAG